MFEPASGAAVAVKEQPDRLAGNRAKPVAVTGASGFVGTQVCAALAAAGWKVRAIVRDPVKAAHRLGHIQLETVKGDIRDEAFLSVALAGCGSLVHLAAVAIERGNDSYDTVNTRATATLLSAAAGAGVSRMIHMSQNGSDSASPYAFLRSKGVAQNAVAASSLRWTILRPSVIFGPDDEFVNVLARLVRMTPFVLPLPNGGRARFQPIFVKDVAAVVVRSLDDDSTIGNMYPLGGPAPLTLREMAERIMTAMQVHRAIVSIGAGIARPAVALMQSLLPSPPVTTSLLDLLAVDNSVPGNTLRTVFDVDPTPFAPEELIYLRRITLASALRSLFKRG